MTTRTRFTVLFISMPVLAFVLLGSLRGRAATDDADIRDLRVFRDVVGLITSSYVEPVKVDSVMDGALRGLADGLDPDSAYLNAAETTAVERGDRLPDGDVGIELTRQYYLRVIAARDGSPAANAGLQTGDYVRAIDGKPTRDLSVFEGVRLLRGAPGTKVSLLVIRGNAADPKTIDLVREKIPPAIVTGHMVQGDVGYLRIGSFDDGIAPTLRREAEALTKSGAKHLVIDIRHTAEGPFASGIEAARLFVPSGTLSIEAGRNEQTPRQTFAAKPGDGAMTTPITLLVTAGTSGAAELFAAALHGNRRADLVGERTLGRAGVQKLVRLPDGCGLWLTYARYLTPSGQPIQGKGLAPDLEVDQPEAPDFDTTTPPPGDPVLDAAMARIHGNQGA
ncbi:MAG TPA: S41 family peptidase [Vicinamibacterales bacterium]|nr:S41 family peptidase [Vicinamibacterales bacterium]